MADFHETTFGKRFFDAQLPSLIGALERIAGSLETSGPKPAPMTIAYGVKGEVFIVMSGDGEFNEGIESVHSTLASAERAATTSNRATFDMVEQAPSKVTNVVKFWRRGTKVDGVLVVGNEWRSIERHGVES